MLDRTEVIARACQSAWYAYAVIGLGEPGEPWDTAPEYQKKSILEVVEFCDKRMSDDYPSHMMATPEWARQALPRYSHEHWMKCRHSEGWVFGETEDGGCKTHPCLVPYKFLTEEQKAKDIVVVEAYLALRDLPGTGEGVASSV